MMRIHSKPYRTESFKYAKCAPSWCSRKRRNFDDLVILMTIVHQVGFGQFGGNRVSQSSQTPQQADSKA